MSRLLTALVFAGIVLGVWGPAEAGDTLKELLRSLEKQRCEAMVQADVNMLNHLLADRCVYTHSTGLVQTKEELMVMLATEEVDYRSIDASEDHRTYSEHTCVFAGRQTIELTVRGKPVTSVSRYTVVWAREGDRWQCVAYQSTPIPKKEGE